VRAAALQRQIDLLDRAGFRLRRADPVPSGKIVKIGFPRAGHGSSILLVVDEGGIRFQTLSEMGKPIWGFYVATQYKILHRVNFIVMKIGRCRP
jgi:hypothetical protein